MTNPGASRVSLAFTVFLILLVFTATYAVGYALYRLLTLGGLPSPLNLPIEIRIAGFAIIAAGITIGSWVLTVRRPLDILVSTSDTFMKLLRLKPIEKLASRTEPFIPKGPYIYVRNPMYFTVLAFIFGLGLANSSTPTLLWGLAQTCWFAFVEIPFEEKELHALFGKSYADYKRQVPMLVPYGKRYRPEANPKSWFNFAWKHGSNESERYLERIPIRRKV